MTIIMCAQNIIVMSTMYVKIWWHANLPSFRTLFFADANTFYGSVCC